VRGGARSRGAGLPDNPPEAVDPPPSKVRTRGRPRAAWPAYTNAAAYRGFPAVVKPEFGTSAAGCVRVDSFELLPGVYKLIRAVVASEQD
jgi:hypothetical protein